MTAKTDVEAARERLDRGLDAWCVYSGAVLFPGDADVRIADIRALLAHSDKLAEEVENATDAAAEAQLCALTQSRLRVATEAKLVALTEAVQELRDWLERTRDERHFPAHLFGWCEEADKRLDALTDTQASGGREEAALPDFVVSAHPEPERTAEIVKEAYAYLATVHLVDGKMPEPALLVERLQSRLIRVTRKPLAPVPAGDVAGMEAALTECRDAVSFFDRVKAATDEEKIAVGQDHWNRLEAAIRQVAALSAPPLGEGS